MQIVKSFKSAFSSHHTLFSQSLISAFVRGLGALSGFVFSVVLARTFSVQEVGIYFLCFSIVSFLAVVVRLGLDNTVLRYVGAFQSEFLWGNVRAVMLKSLIIVTVTSSATALLLYGSAEFLANALFSKANLAQPLKTMSLYIVCFSLSTLVAMGLQGLHRTIRSVFILNISTNLLLITFLIALSPSKLGDAIVALFVFGSITLVLALFFLLRRLPRSESDFSWQTLFQSCLPLWVFMCVGQLLLWSGQLSLGIWSSPEEVGQFAIAQRTAMLTSFVLMAVNVVVAPRFSSLYKQGKTAELEKIARVSVKLISAAALPIVIIMIVFPHWVLQLFGEGFYQGATFLQILAVGQFVNAITGSVGYLLSMSGHERDLRNISWVSGGLVLVLCIVLVPSFGGIGAAIATAVAVASQNLLAVHFVKKRLGFNVLSVWKTA